MHGGGSSLASPSGGKSGTPRGGRSHMHWGSGRGKRWTSNGSTSTWTTACCGSAAAAGALGTRTAAAVPAEERRVTALNGAEATRRRRARSRGPVAAPSACFPNCRISSASIGRSRRPSVPLPVPTGRRGLAVSHQDRPWNVDPRRLRRVEGATHCREGPRRPPPRCPAHCCNGAADPRSPGASSHGPHGLVLDCDGR